MERPGQKLKRVRERLNLTYRDVELASRQIAARRGSDNFVIALSRLADIEHNIRILSAHLPDNRLLYLAPRGEGKPAPP